MNEVIVDSLAQHGWIKDRIVDAFSKHFETAAAPTKQASIWLVFDRECDRWWLTGGEFTSAGENVLASCSAFFPTGMPENEIRQAIDGFVAEMESKIAQAYSVRLLGSRPRA